MELFTLNSFLAVYRVKWVTEPFSPNFSTLMQNSIDNSLNFVTCNQGFTLQWPIQDFSERFSERGRERLLFGHFPPNQ